MKRLAACTALLIALLPGALIAQPEADGTAWWGKYLAGSRLVTLPNGRKLNLYCAGKGKPVVMMESGLGGGAWGWRTVQTAIARTTRTCSYDRAGYWNSPATDGLRDAGAEADDLAALLKAAKLPGPYVIVGHSMGGLIARLYAYRHTADVAGLVLVDPSSAHQLKRMAEVSPQVVAETAEGRAKSKSCAAGPPDFAKVCVSTRSDLPPKLVDWFTHGQTAAYYATMVKEAEAMVGASSDQLDSESKSLGAIPFILLNRGMTGYYKKLVPQEAAAVETIWLQMHRELLDISTDSEIRIIAGAGHNIQNDKPLAVIHAVQDVIAKARH